MTLTGGMTAKKVGVRPRPGFVSKALLGVMNQSFLGVKPAMGGAAAPQKRNRWRHSLKSGGGVGYFRGQYPLPGRLDVMQKRTWKAETRW